MDLLKIALLLLAGSSLTPDAGLVVHEWGTFTSVAGADGRPVSWTTLAGRSDLPCFVHRINAGNSKLAPAEVRMETPVLYFYGTRASGVSVHVSFPQGLVTEWYPQASAVQPKSVIGAPSNGTIVWENLAVLPEAKPNLPQEEKASHYYTARRTDASPVRSGSEQEKMLFYRGMGNFDIPVRAHASKNGALEAVNAGGESIPLVVLFENRQGATHYRLTRNFRDSVTMAEAEDVGTVETLMRLMEEALVNAGLYPKEAHAMLETWRDSWFEEGARVFYIFPRAAADAILPLTVTPPPAGTQRVFVGRVEVFTPWLEATLRKALADGDIQALEKYGRFLQPWINRMRGREDLIMTPSAESYFASAALLIQEQLLSARCVE
jgi:hypothetical protein